MFKNILVPIDVYGVTENTQNALRQAKFLAEVSNANIHLLHVMFHLPKTYARLLSANFDVEARREAQAKLDEWLSSLGLAQDRVTATVTRGSIASEVSREAAGRAADLIVVGSHQPAESSWLMGSNAAAIVRDSKVSVLVCRLAE